MSKFTFRRFADQPELHQDWEERQENRDVTWTELFYDLYFVGALFNISHSLSKHPTAGEAATVLLYNTLFYWTWYQHTGVHTRFRLSGLAYDALTLLHQLGVFLMVLAVQDLSWYKLFAAGYAIAHGAQLLVLSSLFILRPRARRYAALESISRVAAVVLAVAIVGAGPPDLPTAPPLFYILLGCIALVDVLAPALPYLTTSAQLPVHVEHLSERMGLFTILYLGEAIIGLVIEPIVNNLLEFLGLCLAAMVVWCLHLLYYHIHPGQEAHAFRQSKTRGLLFAYSHWLLGCAFLFTATSLRLIIATYPSFNPESERQAGAIPDAPAEAPTPLKLAAAVPPGLGAAWQQLPYPGRRMLAEGGNCAEMESRATRYHIKDGTPSHDLMWLLLVSYAAGLHLLALVRGTHYFTLDQGHVVVLLAKRLRVVGMFGLWWALLVLWPLPLYFIALSPNADALSTTGLLALVCAHAVVLVLAETAITHCISHSPLWDEVMDNPEAAVAAVQQEEAAEPPQGVDVESHDQLLPEVQEVRKEFRSREDYWNNCGSRGGT